MLKCIIFSNDGNGFSGVTVQSKEQLKKMLLEGQKYYFIDNDDKFEDYYVKDGVLKKKDETYHFEIKTKYFKGKLLFSKSMTNKEIDQRIKEYFGDNFQVSKWKKENYSYLRSFFYPSEKELYDGMAKVNSTDPIVKQEGEKQIQSYYAECLGVKKRFPKP